LKFKQVVSGVAGLLVLATVSGCSGSSSQAQAHDQQQVRLTKMLDSRRYDDVIHLIESDSSAQTAFPDLLAMAYLGRSGFEPLEFASSILAQQADNAALNQLIPGCDPSPIQRSSAQMTVRCVLKRLWAHLPNADEADFSKARDLFRAAYPTPQNTPAQYNALIGLVEAASALSRLGEVALKYDEVEATPTQADVDEIFGQIQLAADEAQRTLTRVSFGGSKLSQLLTGLENEPLIQNTGISAAWLENTELPLVIQFANNPDNSVETDAVKAALLQTLDQIVNGLSHE
jgi:hypothetical protein